MNFKETAGAQKLLSLVGKSSFYIIGKMFKPNEVFLDSVAS